MNKKTYLIVFAISTVLFVQCKREPLKIKFQITPLSDFESNDGKISLALSGGKAPYLLQWSNYETDTIISGLSAGTYYVTVTDAKKNLLVDTFEVEQPKWPVCIDAEGNSYKTAIVGGQIWMIENLRVTTNPQGDTIASYIYSDTSNADGGYGRLYTWGVAMNDSTTEESQGICPNGWHIPTDEDWTFLIDNISTADKVIPNIKLDLNLAYAGFYNNGFQSTGTSVSFWTSTQAGNNAWKRYFHKSLSRAFRYHEVKSNAISVRCLKNVPKANL